MPEGLARGQAWNNGRGADRSATFQNANRERRRAGADDDDADVHRILAALSSFAATTTRPPITRSGRWRSIHYDLVVVQQGELTWLGRPETASTGSGRRGLNPYPERFEPPRPGLRRARRYGEAVEAFSRIPGAITHLPSCGGVGPDGRQGPHRHTPRRS
jgi:hypothetical protein